MNDLIAPILIIVATLAAASTGSAFRPGAWYETLDKPSWTPPDWAFPVVWTALYAAMAYATWLVWNAAGLAAWPAFLLYAAHLIANGFWSYLFFGRRRLDWAMAEVVLLWLMIAALAWVYAQYTALAGILFVPYLVWVSIAAALNYRLLRLNGPKGPEHASPV